VLTKNSFIGLIYQDIVVVMMIYIPKENINKVHLDQLVHNNEYFHHPRIIIMWNLLTKTKILLLTFPAK
jgi:hypothetical protein